MSEEDPRLPPPSDQASGGHQLPRLEDVLENTSDCIALLDDRWRFTYLNRNAIKAIGRGRDLVGAALHDVFAGESGTPEWRLTQEAARERRTINFEFFASALGGWFEVHVHPMPVGLQLHFRDVTERRTARQALERSEETLRLALEAAGDAAWDWNIREQSFKVSGPLIERLGYRPVVEKPAIENFASVVHRDDLPRLRLALTDHLAGRSERYECEYRIRAGDGTWRWSMDRGRVIERDPQSGRATRVVGTSSDITDLKTVESLSHDRANLLELALSGAAAGAWSLDPSSGATNLSPRALEILGLSGQADRIVQFQKWADIVHPTDLVQAAEKLQQVINSGGDYTNEYRVLLPGGGQRWVQSRGSAVRDGQGRCLRLLGLIFDVDDRKAAAQALQTSEERLRLALDAAGDGAWDWDLKADRVTRSPRILARLGYEADGTGTASVALLPLVHQEDQAKVRQAVRDHLKGRSETYFAEYRVRGASGEWVWLRDRGRSVEWDAMGRATRMVGTSTDITERKNDELELKRVQSELIHLARVSAMGAMASTLAHELNQPLTSIANYARGIRHRLGDAGADPLLAEALTGVETSSERAGGIVSRLREYVLRGEITRRPEDIHHILVEAAQLALVDAAALGIEYEINVAAGTDAVLADRIQIQQVILNLVRNAVDAMRGTAGRRHLILDARNAEDSVEVRVSDSGPGLTAEALDQLFVPFVSTKSDGMGVGLSICRTIIEAHGGQIRAEAHEGEGAAFIFSLRRAALAG